MAAAQPGRGDLRHRGGDRSRPASQAPRRATSHGNTTLRVDLFGDFGYHDLYKQFEASHPGVTIKEDIEDYATHHSNLAKHLATGAGADDVVAIEVGFIAQFKSEPQYFVDLNQYGAAKLKSQWLPWKWQQSIAPNGAQIGLGTDVGSMGICYRRDLLQAAGLPDEPRCRLEALADLAGVHRHGRAVRAEGAEGHVLLRLGQQRLQRDDRPAQPGLLRREGHRDRRLNPTVKKAWNLTVQGVQKGESAGLAAFSTGLEHGVPAGQLRHRHLPRVDDGLHPGSGAEDGGRLGHRRGARWRRQLGRLVPRVPEAVQERRPRLASWSSS